MARVRLMVLVACEFSGAVRDAFRERGHDAWSCDIVPSEVDGPHIQRDVRDVLDWGWDMMIAHPPCTYLATSGARWFRGREREQAEALAFVLTLMAAPIPRHCIENPMSVISTRIRRKDQVIHPYQFGHPITKTTWLWLKNLPPLRPTNVVQPLRLFNNAFPESPDRPRERSRTFKGIAQAMAEQWGNL